MIALSAGGVYVTKDAGDTWAASNHGVAAPFLPDPDPEFGQCVHKVVADPANPEHLLLQNHGGVFRSTDWGENWSAQRLACQPIWIWDCCRYDAWKSGVLLPARCRHSRFPPTIVQGCTAPTTGACHGRTHRQDYQWRLLLDRVARCVTVDESIQPVCTSVHDPVKCGPVLTLANRGRRPSLTFPTYFVYVPRRSREHARTARLPANLAELVGGRRELWVSVDGEQATVAQVLDVVGRRASGLGAADTRRVRWAAQIRQRVRRWNRHSFVADAGHVVGRWCPGTGDPLHRGWLGAKTGPNTRGSERSTAAEAG